MISRYKPVSAAGCGTCLVNDPVAGLMWEHAPHSTDMMKCFSITQHSGPVGDIKWMQAI